MLLFLIQNGANVNHVRTDNGATALYMAAERGLRTIVTLLLDHGADPNIARYDPNEKKLIFFFQ